MLKLNFAIQRLSKRPIVAGALLGAIVLGLPGESRVAPALFERNAQGETARDFAPLDKNRAVVIDPDTKAITLESIDIN